MGKSTSLLLQSQDTDNRSTEHYSASSSSRSISSTQSPQNWYHRKSNRLMPNLASIQHPRHLRSFTSIRELARKTSRSLLTTTANHRHSLSNNQSGLDQRNGSVTQLPGSFGGPSCRPITLIVQDSTHSSLESLVPDQTILSSELGEPATPVAAEIIYSAPILGQGSIGQAMGNTDSKVVQAKVSKVIRKPVSGLLKGKKSQQTVGADSSPTPKLVPKRASEHPTEPATAKAKERVKENLNPVGPPPVLRHRASSGQLQVPRRRSSLTAIHLDSSHFEKPPSSKKSDSNNQGNRASSFSESCQPTITSSNATTVVPSPNPQQNDKSGEPHSPRLLSPRSSDRRLSSAGSSTQTSITPKPSHIHFPMTWPEGPPELKPATLTSMHYKCYRSHQLMRKERAMFNQVPCMTCGVHDKQERYTCSWCELRVCKSCMKQLLSVGGRSLALLLEWVAERKQQDLAVQVKESVGKEPSEETVEQQKSGETLQKVGSAERPGSKAQSFETVKVKKQDGLGLPVETDDARMDAIAADHGAGEKYLNEVERMEKVEMTKAANLAAEETDAKEEATPAGQTMLAEKPATEEETGLRGGSVRGTIGSSFRSAHSERSWDRAKAYRVLRESRG